MSEIPTQSPPSRSGFSRFLTVFLRALVRLALVILVGTVVGLAAYLTIAIVYSRVIEAQQANAIRLSALETQQAAQNEDLYQRISRLDEQILALENRHNQANESLRNLYGEIEKLRQESKDNAALQQRLKELETRLDRLSEFTAEVSTQVMALQLTPLYGQKEQLELQQEVKFIHILELLNRSRMYLMQSNFMLAKREVEKAQKVLLELMAGATPYQIPVLNEVAKRLNAAYLNLPDNPVLAADDLEIVWQTLSTGWSTPTPAQTSAPTVSGTPSPLPVTATPSPT